MGFFDRLFGNEPQQNDGYGQQRQAPRARDENEIALERYRYLLRTAPPETIEKVHAEAFEKLTPEQRQLLFTELTENAPAGEAPRGADSASLASAATRSELRNPGTMERTMGGNQGGMGFGSMVASSLLGTVAGYVIGSALVSAFMPDMSGDGSGDASADSGDSGDATSADGGGYDSGADSGGDFGGGGFGDFGGGDFGGGDF